MTPAEQFIDSVKQMIEQAHQVSLGNAEFEHTVAITYGELNEALLYKKDQKSSAFDSITKNAMSTIMVYND